MFRAISFCLAGSLVVAIIAAAAFTTPPWPSPSYYGGTNKDARVSQIYSAMVERSVACYGFVAVTSPPPYIYEREAVVRFKAFVASAVTNFVDLSQADSNGTFSAYFAANTNADDFPMLSITSLLAAVGAPTNYFERTPWQQLNGGGYPITSSYCYGSFSELDYGWRYATNIVAMLRATAQPAYWQDSAITNDASQTACGSECSSFEAVTNAFHLITHFGGIQTTGGLFGVTDGRGGSNASPALADRCLAEMPTPTYYAMSKVDGFMFAEQDVIGWFATWANVFIRPVARPIVSVPASSRPERVDYYVRDVWWTSFCGYPIELNQDNTNAPYRRLLWTAATNGVGPLDYDQPTCEYGAGTNTDWAFAGGPGGAPLVYDPWFGKVPTADQLQDGLWGDGCPRTVFLSGNYGLPLDCYAAMIDCTGGTVENESQFRATLTEPIIGSAASGARANAVIFWPFAY